MSESEHECSVVLITYDRGTEILSRSLNSVLCQTSKPKEIFIVDGGDAEHRSRTSSFVSSVDSCGVPVTVVGDHEMTAPEARNLGASLCTGDYVAFLDDDDEWYPDKLSSQMSQLSECPALVYSPYDEEFRGKVRVYSFEQMGYPAILERNVVGCTSFVLVRRDVFAEVGGFDTSFPSNQEWDLWMVILKNHASAFCDTPAGRKHESQGITADSGRRLKGWKAVFRKHRAEYREFPEAHRKASATFYNDMASRRCYLGALSARIEMMR